ncbi:MAG TPA: hypothetical protein VGG33_27755 [Polyangia bacterium]
MNGLPASTSPSTFEPASSVEERICEAIRNRRLLAFSLAGLARIGEPHDFGFKAGKRGLFFYQTGGASRSGPPHGWRWADLDKIDDVRVLMQRFAGPRPVPSGRHHRWDHLIASVSRPPGPALLAER